MNEKLIVGWCRGASRPFAVFPDMEAARRYQAEQIKVAKMIHSATVAVSFETEWFFYEVPYKAE